jgi:hypothetical protein
VSEVKKLVDEGKKQPRMIKTCNEVDCRDGNTMCHKIPLTNDLYLETHTHVVKNKTPELRRKAGRTAEDDYDHGARTVQSEICRPTKKKNNYEIENEYLRNEIERLNKAVEKVKILQQRESRRRRYTATEVKSVSPGFIRQGGASTQQQPLVIPKVKEVKTKSPTKTPAAFVLKESRGTSTTNINAPIVEKRSGITQTDGLSPEKLTKAQQQVYQKSSKDEQLELENLALKREANRVLLELQKAQNEHQESIATMKELYQTAESLKRENQELLGAQEQQQFMQENLIRAMTENQKLKNILEPAMQKVEDSVKKEQENAKMRYVIA